MDSIERNDDPNNSNSNSAVDSISKMVRLYPSEGALLHQVYLDLKIVKNWHDLFPRENDDDGLCYLEGKETASSSFQIVFPVSAHDRIKVEDLLELFNKLKHKKTLQSGVHSHQLLPLDYLTLGIVDSDSTISYYKIHSKLVPPKIELPSGLLVAGDAVVCFTPVYGQGISVACLEAEQLEIVLKQNTPTQKLSSEFFSRITPIIDSAWNLATNNDMKDPKIVGKRSFFMTLFSKYFALLMHLGNNDSSIHQITFDVMHMRQPPTAIMKPKFIFYALLYLIGLKKDGKTDQPFPRGGPQERIGV